MKKIVKTLKAIVLSEFVQMVSFVFLFIGGFIALCAGITYGFQCIKNVQEAEASEYQAIDKVKKESTDPEWHKYLSDTTKKNKCLLHGEYRALISKHETFKKQKMMEGFK